MRPPELFHDRLKPVERALVDIVGDAISPAGREELLQRWAGSNKLLQFAQQQHLPGRFVDRLDSASEPTRAAWRAQAEDLEDARRGARIRALKRRSQAGFTLKVLAQAGLQGIVLKGLVLAEQVYQAEHQREMGDLDILVADRFEDGLQALLAAGATRTWSDPLKQAYERTDGHHVRLQLPFPASMALELHWRLYPDMHVAAVADIAARATLGTCAGEPAWIPSHEHHLLLCAHHLVTSFVYQRPCVLRWWLDLDQMLRARSTDWDRWLQSAMAWGIPLTAGLGLAGAVQLFRSPVPEALWEQIDRVCQPIERRVLRFGLRQGAYVLNRDVVLAALWFNRGVGFRTRSAAQLVKTPRVEARSRLPKVPASAAVAYLALSRLLRIARASATHLRLWVALHTDEGSR